MIFISANICLFPGYVTDYGDIDVFVQDTHLSEFVEMLKKANPLCHLHEYGSKPNPNYPDQYQVYTVWTGAKKTDIQVSIWLLKFLMLLTAHSK